MKIKVRPGRWQLSTDANGIKHTYLFNKDNSRLSVIWDEGYKRVIFYADFHFFEDKTFRSLSKAKAYVEKQHEEYVLSLIEVEE